MRIELVPCIHRPVWNLFLSLNDINQFFLLFLAVLGYTSINFEMSERWSGLTMCL